MTLRFRAGTGSLLRGAPFFYAQIICIGMGYFYPYIEESNLKIMKEALPEPTYAFLLWEHSELPTGFLAQYTHIPMIFDYRVLEGMTRDKKRCGPMDFYIPTITQASFHAILGDDNRLYHPILINDN